MAELKSLPQDALAEVIREGELRLQAQFEAANSADQRAMAWCGLLLTVTLASIGGAVSLLIGGAHILLAAVTLLFAIIIGLATFFALDSVRPREFALPGNLPENWLPEYWERGKTLDIAQARVEQASCLNNLIDDNRVWAERAGKSLQRSMDIAVRSVLFAVPATALSELAQKYLW